jgi:hypothetical protein
VIPLTESVDGVIGVDTHRDTLAAAALTTIGANLGNTEATADASGYQQPDDDAALAIPNGANARPTELRGRRASRTPATAPNRTAAIAIDRRPAVNAPASLWRYMAPRVTEQARRRRPIVNRSFEENDRSTRQPRRQTGETTDHRDVD